MIAARPFYLIDTICEKIVSGFRLSIKMSSANVTQKRRQEWMLFTSYQRSAQKCDFLRAVRPLDASATKVIAKNADSINASCSTSGRFLLIGQFGHKSHRQKRNNNNLLLNRPVISNPTRFYLNFVTKILKFIN